MANARELLIQRFAEEKRKVRPEFGEMGSRLDDLSVFSDGRLNDDEEISLDTFRKMRKDPQVKACLLVLKLPLIQVDWSIHADTDQGQEIAKWIEARLYDMDDSMQYYLREMLTALDFGRSITEKVWGLREVPVDPDQPDGRRDQMVVPTKLKTYDPGALTFKLNPETGKLEGVLQRQRNREIMIPAEKLLIYTHEKEFGDYNGLSTLKAAYKPWIIKEFLQKFWNIALERYGTPFMAMKMPQGGSLKSAMQLMDGIKSKAGIPLPEGYDLDVHALANTGMSFKEAIEYQDKQIARAMLIPDLVFGNSDSGAYALSKTHAAFFLLRLNAISQELGDAISSYLIKPLVQYNFGDVQEFPIMKFSDVGEEDIGALATVLDLMIKGKVIAPSEDWIRERLGLPQADEEAQEWLDKQRDLQMEGLENIQKANATLQNPKKKDPEIDVQVDPEGKKKQIQKNAEDVDYMVDDLRKSIRGILKLGISREE
jgi:phage gp29-like protein